MVKSLVQLTLALLLLLCAGAGAAACTCLDSPSPCASFQATPVVFVGLVKSIEEEMVEINRFGKIGKLRVGLKARFIVEERLKEIGEAEVDVVTGGGGGDCGYSFKAGERYLVYAHRTEEGALGSSMSRTVIAGGQSSLEKRGALTTSICSRTQPLSRAQNDLELIRALNNGKPQTRLFGNVHEFVSKLGDSAFGRDVQYKPKAGLTIKAEGPAGAFETTTDAAGNFLLNELKPGKYKVRLLLPPAYGMRYSFEKNEFEIEVTTGCWGAEADFTVTVDGRIGGQVYDAQGKAVGEQVQVQIVAYEGAGGASAEARNEYTNKQGRYEFRGVPAGRYLLGVNIADVPDRATPYSKLYYPSGSAPEQATIINLGEGQKLNDHDFHLPAPLAKQTITGVVYLQNGKPGAGAAVELYDSEKPDGGVWGIDAKTDRQGRFTINVFKARRYQLRAYLDEDYLEGKGVQSEMVDVDSQGAAPVKLILNKPGIFREQK